MRVAVTVARLLLGILFFVVGINGFLMFLPPPPPGTLPSGAVALSTAFAQSGYLMQLAMGTQVVAAILLLTDQFVPLALALLAPVIVNIIAFHLFLWRGGSLPMGVLALGLEIFLAWAYGPSFRPMLARRAEKRA